MCINSYNVHWLPTSRGSGVMLCQCGFGKESLDCTHPSSGSEGAVGFELPDQTLDHQAVLT